MFLLKSFDCLNALSSCRMAAQKTPERLFSRISSILLLIRLGQPFKEMSKVSGRNMLLIQGI
ncbi:MULTISPECIES: hypothetical protein [unclassified Acinetobacter]|uniref:hypothetical protein n=1 Tax=unclassified Acinetobacter TaxID=196816 RepID=UPI001387559B|nr:MULTISPECIES: hypothetical protein [unclassified Acinetobacter]